MNTTLKLFSVLLLTLVMGCNMTGCGVSNTEPFVDVEKDEQGNLRLKDTPRMWQNWTENVDFRISNEVAGRRPPGGASTWEDFWMLLIEQNRDGGRENSQRYINYILLKRQEAGLAPLESDSG